MGISYFNEYRDSGGVIVSVDMVTVDGKFYGRPEDVETRFFNCVRDCLWNYTTWISYKLGSYRYQYSVECEDGCSFWFGLGFNSPSDSFPVTCARWRIEFNPNKVFREPSFLKVYSTFLQLSRKFEVKRFDLAVDYPVSRSCCFLAKDLRTYSERTNSMDDRTQYLGQRSHHGFVKLYNKQLESKLPIPFTRLELTVDYNQRNWSDVEKSFPKVYVVEDMQLSMDHVKLTDTDKFILFACFNDPDSVKMLGRDKRKKTESIMQQYSRSLQIGKKAYTHILSVLMEIVNPIFVFEMMVFKDELPDLQKFYTPADFKSCSPEECLFDWGVVEHRVEGEVSGGVQ